MQVYLFYRPNFPFQCTKRKKVYLDLFLRTLKQALDATGFTSVFIYSHSHSSALTTPAMVNILMCELKDGGMQYPSLMERKSPLLCKGGGPLP